MTELHIRKVLALRGPNIWASFPVLEAWVDVGKYYETPSNSIPGFVERLKAWLPSLIEHRCSVGERGGFFQRLDSGTYPAHILEHLALELQTLAGTPVGFGKARETSEKGVYRVVVRYRDEALGRASIEAARRLLLAAIHDEPFDSKLEIEKLQEIAYQSMLGPSTKAIVDAAKNRGIPTRRLNEYSLVQLGYGVKQRRIQAAETDMTSAIAEGIAQDKEFTRKLLRTAAVPVPYGCTVETVEDAVKAASEIGYPVVVKPYDGNQGRGVTTNLQNEADVRTAFDAAQKRSNTIIVEKHIDGDDYRVLIVGNRVSAAARREPAHVIGDGKKTIQELVEIVNSDPRRADYHANVLSKIKIDEIGLAVLESQGFTPSSIPNSAAKVLIRRNANLSTGGTAIDVTDELHPEVAARAIDAAKMVGLDIAGVDIVTTDITRPLEEAGGAVIEVNAAPGLRMHLEPSEGKPRAVGSDIVSLMFDENENGRIPIVAVSGVNGKTTTVRTIAHILRTAGKVVGMTTTDGIDVGTRRIESGDCSGPKSAGMILMNPSVEAAVFETARGGILREGLAFDNCEVAVVTNIGTGDHLGLSEIQTVEELASLKQCIVDAVAPWGTAVLNAADPLVARMAPHSRGKVLFFALDDKNDTIAGQRASDGRVVFVRSGEIICAEGKTEFPIISVREIPITRNGELRFHVENMIASVGAAWSLNIPFETIRTALQTTSNALSCTRGRFSVYEMKDRTVILDYGHNTDALEAVTNAIDKFPNSYRSVVYAAAGDRRDIDIVDQGRLLGKAFDKVYIYEEESFLRGRKEGEMAEIFKRGICENARTKEIVPMHGSVATCKHAVLSMKPGELLLLQLDSVDETIEWFEKYLRDEILS